METLNIDDVINYLQPIAWSIELDNVHWVNNCDASYTWCGSCAKYFARHMRRHSKKNRYEYFVDGGWGSEEDGATRSNTGRLLTGYISGRG